MNDVFMKPIAQNHCYPLNVTLRGRFLATKGLAMAGMRCFTAKERRFSMTSYVLESYPVFTV